MNDKLEISVVIPVLNEAQNLRELIPFLLENAGNYIVDLFVIDGGSRDDSCAVAESLGARVVKSETASRAIQMNLGAKLACGNMLFFIHADTRPLSSFAEDIHQAWREGYKSGCFRYRFNSSRVLLRINSWFTQFNGIFSGGGDQTLFITRDFFNTLGGYDTQFCLMEDFELVKRIKSKTKFFIIPKSMTVSARKYQENSWLRIQLANLLIFTLFYLGVAPEKLKKSYSLFLHNGANA
ncbi:TIGR04283 family arsenosugar biosynthesis glycosyltransferase [Algoriphagus jejuensis]|uniref:TIGR04283 family arsenosugar biosynthesis glycosyltransferase n=1 Tax=Algoriphagus jejuensis TaxID=419934 RepID=A0ABP3YGU8_9BACT